MTLTLIEYGYLRATVDAARYDLHSVSLTGGFIRTFAADRERAVAEETRGGQVKVIFLKER